MSKTKTFKPFSEITAIKDSKVIIPFNIGDIPSFMIGDVRRYVKKVYQIDTENTRDINLSLRDFNRFFEKNNNTNFNISPCPISWNGVLDLLGQYIESRVINEDHSIDYSTQKTVNKLINDFFRFMPFVKIKAEGIEFQYFALGYCCEDCDGKKEDIKLYEFKNQVKDFIKRQKATQTITIKSTKL